MKGKKQEAQEKKAFFDEKGFFGEKGSIGTQCEGRKIMGKETTSLQDLQFFFSPLQRQVVVQKQNKQKKRREGESYCMYYIQFTRGREQEGTEGWEQIGKNNDK